jgi:nucleotide-binding universal stress UspA family protein
MHAVSVYPGYRDILVHVGGRAAALGRLRLGAALANGSGSRLTGLHVRPANDIEPTPRFLLEDAVERHAASLAVQAKDAEDRFDDEVGAMTGATWRHLDGDVVEGICRCACVVDLVIVGQSEWQRPVHTHPLPIAHSVIRLCGRPVLVVPDDHTGRAPRRIAIAWNGSRQVVRAVHDAMPLLLTATSIDIVTDGGADADSAYALAQHLDDHGCASSANVIVSARHAASRGALSRTMVSGDHDLLVIGGSTNPTWQESIFGGATRSILMKSKIPVLAAI